MVKAVIIAVAMAAESSLVSTIIDAEAQAEERAIVILSELLLVLLKQEVSVPIQVP